MSEINTRSMARILLSQGRLKESLEVYGEILKITPGDPLLAAEMHEVETRLGKPQHPQGRMSLNQRKRGRAFLESLLARIDHRRKSPALWPYVPPEEIKPAVLEAAIDPAWASHEKRARAIRFLGSMLDKVAARKRG